MVVLSRRKKSFLQIISIFCLIIFSVYFLLVNLDKWPLFQLAKNPRIYPKQCIDPWADGEDLEDLIESFGKKLYITTNPTVQFCSGLGNQVWNKKIKILRKLYFFGMCIWQFI
jgi:hypothetical protein